VDISACRNLLQQAWEGVVSALPEHERNDCDLSIINDMPDAEVAAWMHGVTVDGLYLSTSVDRQSNTITPCLR
jgi:hypothetical protein